MTWVLIAVLIVSLLLIPLGLPGLWIMVGALGVGAMLREVGLAVVLATTTIAVAAELIEFVLLKRLTRQYGGSRRAFWGAIAGGMIGVIVGVPVPIVGSIVAGLIGSFVGAAVVTYAETKQLGSAQRVGWGAVIGRALSAVTKTVAGFGILVLGVAALMS